MIRKPAVALLVLSLAVLALALVPAAGLAAKGGNGAGGGGSGGGHGGGGGGTTGGGSLTLEMVNDVNGNRLPNYGDTVTFTVSTTVTSYPYVTLSCTQGGFSVYQSSYLVGFFPSYPWPWLQNFVLSSQAWTGGAASCTAKLEYNNGSKWAVITSLNFDVAE